MDIRPLITKKEAAKMLNCCVRSVENIVARKEIAVIRFGRRCVRFRPEDVEAYVERCHHPVIAVNEEGRAFTVEDIGQ